MDDHALNAANGAGRGTSAPRTAMPWAARPMGILTIIFILCATAFFYTVSQAAASETVIVLDDSTDPAEDHHVDIFKTAYTGGDGDVSVLSRDGTAVIAPGASGGHRIRIRNDNAFTVEYEINVNTSAENAPECELPLCVRVTAALVSPKAWTNIKGTESETLKGMLDTGQEMNFYYQWQWDDSNDVLDTWLAQEYPDMELYVVADINAQEYIEPVPEPDDGQESGCPDSGGQDSGSQDSTDSDGGSQGSTSRKSGSSSSGGSSGSGTGRSSTSRKKTVFWGLLGPGSLTLYAQGSYHKTSSGEQGWINDAMTGEWYYSTALTGAAVLLPENLCKGWLYETRDGRWYYLAPESGKMCKGWQKIGGAWYYFTTRQDADDHDWNAELTSEGHTIWQYHGQGAHSYGAMYENEYTPDGYFVDSEGRWVEGG